MAVGEVGPGTKWRRVESSRRKSNGRSIRFALARTLVLRPNSSRLCVASGQWQMKSQTLRHLHAGEKLT
ncbi:hypothetical protein ALC60_10266 [Trachymyrmex zeteki]|uniref:Uncharacterized protein n=1 Tax=Mycetomoellerius zeteki TaxID=64791 RepID=A0A151WS57_9HYME|nr:hypothetical protein ALC60_10266 [Trachymyrmex zeteki]